MKGVVILLSLKRKSSVILLAVSIVLISVSSVFSVSAAEIEENQDGSITLTERYNANSPDEKYKFEDDFEYNGKQYILNTDSIKADVLSKTPELEIKHETYEESSIGYTEVIEAEDKEVTNEEDGETYLAVVEDIKNERTTITDRTAEVSFDRTVTVPVTEDAEIEQEWTFEYTDVEGGNRVVEVTAPLKEQSVAAGDWQDTDYPISLVVTGYGADEITMLGEVITLGDDIPFSEDDYSLVLRAGGRDSENYRITSTVWDGAAYNDGGVIKRNAIAYTQQRVKTYSLKYAGEVSLPDYEGYETTVVYGYDRQVPSDTNISYFLSGSATYSPVQEDNTVLVVTISVGLAVLVIAAAVILFVVMKKRKVKV